MINLFKSSISPKAIFGLLAAMAKGLVIGFNALLLNSYSSILDIKAKLRSPIEAQYSIMQYHFSKCNFQDAVFRAWILTKFLKYHDSEMDYIAGVSYFHMKKYDKAVPMLQKYLLYGKQHISEVETLLLISNSVLAEKITLPSSTLQRLRELLLKAIVSKTSLSILQYITHKFFKADQYMIHRNIASSIKTLLSANTDIILIDIQFLYSLTGLYLKDEIENCLLVGVDYDKKMLPHYNTLPTIIELRSPTKFISRLLDGKTSVPQNIQNTLGYDKIVSALPPKIESCIALFCDVMTYHANWLTLLSNMCKKLSQNSQIIVTFRTLEGITGTLYHQEHMMLYEEEFVKNALSSIGITTENSYHIDNYAILSDKKYETVLLIAKKL
ncbi:hypothetical protein Fsol_00551 [Candidatus Fokinia solitaria]|uniref:Methyltransferase n=1 Tax=Candidatus Fokinia solitaria TaxID=1802984 RepID=A0A2U8BSL3_9RICK|nr:hypothetical protein [Candidatus Fokinia solitaria]AWD33339.1 hypothetical protein Fsol_00551 [Candidatus Fokinia solitaria]